MSVIPRRHFLRQSACGLLAADMLLRSAEAAAPDVTANTHLGKVRGVDTGAVKQFKGIAVRRRHRGFQSLHAAERPTAVGGGSQCVGVWP